MILTRFAEKVVKELETSEKIETEDRDLYQYGIEQGIMIVLNAISAVIVGFVFHRLLFVILFSAAFIPLRTFSGGYHAKSRGVCYLLSVAAIILLCILENHFCIRNMISVVISFFCAGIIFWLSPVEAKNKPLDNLEIKTYRRRTHLILLLEAVLLVIRKSK